MPLPVPTGPWKSVSCDFIVELPPSNGFDSVLVFVDRFTKMVHFAPCTKSTDAPGFARIFLDHVVKLHGLPESLVSDRGSVFTSRFWRSLAKTMGVNPKLSTAYHPQTDGQTERMNQVLEQYLRIYSSYQQDNWVNYLSMAEFAINNAHQASLRCSPFFANYGYNPSFNIDIRRSNIPVPAAKAIAENLGRLHDTLRDNLVYAQDQQAKYYDAGHKRIDFEVGNKVWLLSTNIRTARPSKKLDWKRIGPFSVVNRIGTQAYRLALPPTMKIHNVFHVSLLEPYHESAIPGRIRPPPPPVIVDNNQEFEVEEILDSRRERKSLLYLVKWKGYLTSDNSWEPASYVKNAASLVKAFHDRYPNKPR